MRNRGDLSIDLRNLDGVILEDESDKEDHSTSIKGPAMQDILQFHDKPMQRWKTFFFFVCAFAVFLDPMFCYVQVVRADYMCIEYDMKLFWAYCGLRTACDVFYVIDIIIFLCRICKKRITSSKKTSALPLKERLKKRCFLSILPRILVSLPIPAMFVVLNASNYIVPFDAIIITTPFQYTVRVLLIYRSQMWRPIKKNTRGRWLFKPLLDFLPFILASHLFGALWYRLAVERLIDCWIQHCQQLEGYSCRSIPEEFQCPSNYSAGINTTRVQELCPTKAADSRIFDLGIYLYAFQSNATGPSNLSQRILQSFWWALRNMRPKARSNKLKLKGKKQLMKPDIDLWLAKNDLSNLKIKIRDSKDLKTTIKRKTLKMVIIENIDKLEENKDIDLQNIITVLPIKFKKNITRLLCLASLSKVPMLANLNAKTLKVICEHLKPVIYTEDSCIVQEGKPLSMMIFITQGLAWSYTTSNVDDGGTSCGSSTTKWLKRGDFYGEELLNWAFKSPSYTALPFSTRTVLSQEKVEAFTLRASDLMNIVRDFWWHFTIGLKQGELVQWENAAASSIQRAWRNRLAKARRSNRWNKFTAHY